MAYSVMAEGRDNEQLEELDAAIGMIVGPEQTAMEALNAHRAEMGLPPLEVPHD